MHATHDNNFDFLRFAAAVMVWYGHCYALTGAADPLNKAIHFRDLGGLGVSIFFVISGYFITASYERHNNPLAFFKNRALRILPALAGVVVFSVFVIGPLATTLSLGDYFEHSRTWRYFRTLLILPLQYELPGVFENLPHKAVNGSLWTLQHEVRCYAVVAVLGMLCILQPRMLLALFAACAAILVYGAWCGDNPPKSLFSVRWEKLRIAVWLGFLFTGGGVVYLYRQNIPRHVGLLTGCILLMLFSLGMPAQWGAIVFDCAVIYSVIYIGFLRMPVLPRFGQYGDFSYGFYLYAFPIQQLTLHFMQGAKTPLGEFMIISFVITLACAVASWHLIEKRALLYKS